MKHSTQVLRVLVIVHVRCCPTVIVPPQLPSVLLVKKVPAGAVSVTLNVPRPSVTLTPAADPAKLAGIGLLPVTCIVKLDGLGTSLPETIFMTVNVAVVGVDVGGGVVLFAAADC